MGIEPTPATAMHYQPRRSLQYNISHGVIFTWRGGRGGEIGKLQGLYMQYLRKGLDGRWMLNLPFNTDADMASSSATMRAHHVSDSVIKRHIVEWVNSGMTMASLFRILQDVSSVNTLTFPDVVFPEKVALIWGQWLFGWMETISSFLLSASSMPCAAVLWFAEALVGNMSTAIANFRPGFGITDGQGIAAAICPREATAPSWNAFNKLIMSISGYNCGRISIESLWVSMRFSTTLSNVNLTQTTENNAIVGKHGQPVKMMIANAFNAPVSNMAHPLTTFPSEIYSSELSTARPSRHHGLTVTNTGGFAALPVPAQARSVMGTVTLRSMLVTAISGGFGYFLCFYFLLPFITLLMSLGHESKEL